MPQRQLSARLGSGCGEETISGFGECDGEFAVCSDSLREISWLVSVAQCGWRCPVPVSNYGTSLLRIMVTVH